MTQPAVVFVPYRPVWYYERLGPCVRDWAMMETAFKICATRRLPAYVVDRPSFPPWRSHASDAPPLRHLGDVLPADRIIATGRVPLMSALLHSRKASRPIVERTLHGIASHHNQLLMLDFDPFADIIAPGNATHWFDEIDDFSKHRRMPARDRRAFLAKRRSPHAIHTASSLESTEGAALPNWVFTPIVPGSSDVAPPYKFGYVGYVDNKMDLDLVAQIAAAGRLGIWGKILDREVHRKLSEIANVDLLGEYDASQLQDIMNQFQVGTIPFLLDRIHGNSPIKYYQYSAAHKPCLSTSAFGLVRQNLVVVDAGLPQALDRLPTPEAVDWGEIERQNNEGKDLFETRFAAALDALA